jgi:hypothetical protein
VTVDVQMHIDRLDQRRKWLTERIKAKQTVGWCVEYDTSERDALAWALEFIYSKRESNVSASRDLIDALAESHKAFVEFSKRAAAAISERTDRMMCNQQDGRD